LRKLWKFDVHLESFQEGKVVDTYHCREEMTLIEESEGNEPVIVLPN